MHPPSRKAADEALKDLQANKDAWAALGIDERIVILEEISRDMLQLAERWVAASIHEKGIPENTLGEGEEWAMLSSIFREVRLLRQSLIGIRKHGRPGTKRCTLRPGGQAAVKVFPQTLSDSILFRGVNGEVWMEPGITADEAVKTQARVYQDKSHKGKIVVVLGAGNASCLVPGDFLYKLFAENMVVILKTNPVNAYLGPLLEEGFSALIQRGFFRIVEGGAEEGAYLCNHPVVDEIHITGSDKTLEAIVFGPGPEGARRKAERSPLLLKKITAELGNITPVIVVPGPWNDRDVMEQAIELVSWLACNAGFNCHTPRVIIQHKNWSHRDAFIGAIGDVLSKTETRKGYYPGAKERRAAFIAAHPEARQFGGADGGHLPWTFIADVDPHSREDICFRTEPFCSLFSETAIEAPGVPEFVDRAVEFANETLWGTLYAAIVVHPGTLKDPQVAAALERAIAGLGYGMIGVNLRAEYVYGRMLAPWGGFPGHDVYDVQSGIGFTNNVLLFDRPQKAVFRGPFRKRLNPVTVTSKRAKEFYRKMAYFEASPSLRKLLGLLWTAVRS
ncbi:MAG: aldehyde dehydrogenase family protein [Nitrospirota bacterium]|nr:aldehyde dehydrogenase family protein [Nitrospirota bacterium]